MKQYYKLTVCKLVKARESHFKYTVILEPSRRFIRVRSIHDELSGLLKHVICSTKFFRLYVLRKSEKVFSLTSKCKSPKWIIFSKSVDNLPKAALMLLRWKAIFSLWWLYEHPSSHFLLLTLRSTKNPSNNSFKMIYFMYLLDKFSFI